MDDEDRTHASHASLQELAEADLAYRAAFSQLSRGTLDPSSFERLLTSVQRLREATQRLRDTSDGTPTDGAGLAA
jgi:hypothetical protein